jgi:hypothetical protein
LARTFWVLGMCGATFKVDDPNIHDRVGPSEDPILTAESHCGFTLGNYYNMQRQPSSAFSSSDADNQGALTNCCVSILVARGCLPPTRRTFPLGIPALARAPAT